jgi:large subunit ribosomal protein L13
MKTVFFNKKNIPLKKWLLVDAKNEILGRLSSKIAYVLQGKDKPYFTPNCDVGDFIIVINAQYINLSKKKAQNKYYWRHTGYPGGIKKTSFLDLKNSFPERIIYYAVRRMLPKTKLGRQMLKKLKIYAQRKHNNMAQKPKLLSI